VRWVGNVAVMGRNAFRVLLSKPEGKRQLGKPRHRRRIMLKLTFIN
jgi:hypothetical protein